MGQICCSEHTKNPITGNLQTSLIREDHQNSTRNARLSMLAPTTVTFTKSTMTAGFNSSPKFQENDLASNSKFHRKTGKTAKTQEHMKAKSSQTVQTQTVNEVTESKLKINSNDLSMVSEEQMMTLGQNMQKPSHNRSAKVKRER